MKILFVTQLTHRGGVDTFATNLLGGWREEHGADRLVFRINQSHPGLASHLSQLNGIVDVGALDFRLYTDDLIAPGRAAANKLVKGALRAYRGASTESQFRELFRELSPDRLIWLAGGYPGGDSLAGALKAWNRLDLGPKPVLNVHNLAVSSVGFGMHQGNWLDQRIAREAGAIVAVSRACAESFRQRPALWKHVPITYVHNGVKGFAGSHNRTHARTRIRAEMGVSAAVPLCLMLATYEPRKGHSFLFDAFERVVDRLPEARLLVCGDGSDADIARVRVECEARGLGRHVAFWKFREDREELLLAADVLVVPSQAFESFGLVCVEAFSAGLPVVATAIGGLTEVVVNERGGFSVPVREAGIFGNCVLSLLVSPELRLAQGQAGLDRYETMFSLKKMVNSYAEIVRAADPAVALRQSANGLINS